MIREAEHVMTMVTDATPQELMSLAAAGPVLEAEIISLHEQRGKLRVAYDLPGAPLLCCPTDDSEFLWVVHKLRDNVVALSPKSPHDGKTLYASVRDDNHWFVQTRAPISKDWINAIRRDEEIRMSGHGFFSVSFQGFNAAYVAVDEQPSPPGASFRLRATGSPDARLRTFFLGVRKSMQAQLRVPLAHEITNAEIQRAYTTSGLMATPEEVVRLRARLAFQ